MKRRFLIVLLVLALPLVLTTPATPATAATGATTPATATVAAGATTGWAVQSTPNPAGVTDALDAVSCASATSCTAVVDSGLAAEHWDGSTWTVQVLPPAPGGQDYGFLNGVACPSVTSCIAVGDYSDNAGNGFLLAEQWNGSTWTVQTVPNPAGALDPAFFGVSCASVTSCTAVGRYTDSSFSSFTLAEHWNGQAWRIQSTPRPSDSSGSTDALLGVSCLSATNCTAAGEYESTANAPAVLAEHWNGSTWKVQPTPGPSGATSIDVSGISCAVSASCTLVGGYTTASATSPALVEHWNGTTWTLQAAAGQPAGSERVFKAVSCPAAADCTAVGASFSGPGAADATLAEHWNGTSWTVQTTPKLKASTLYGVSCATAAGCTAVGSYGNAHPSTLAERSESTQNGTSTDATTSLCRTALSHPRRANAARCGTSTPDPQAPRSP